MRVVGDGRLDNYLEHIRELGNDEREPPFFFAKHRDMIVQNGGTVAYPTLTSDYQHEIELVVAMKSGGQNIPRDQALSHALPPGRRTARWRPRAPAPACRWRSPGH